MAHTVQFAVLSREQPGPTPDQLKRAFRSFSNLTDADAVRLALGAHGVLMKHLGQESARALQIAFQDQGVRVAIVAESDLPSLTEPRLVHHIDLWPQALTLHDPIGHATKLAWPEITLVAAGAAQHVGLNRTQTEFLRRQLGAASEARAMKADHSGPQIDSDSQLVLELIVGRGTIRYEIDAAQFAFKSVIDRPGLSHEEKFVWLVREICHYATHATFNEGARLLREGHKRVPKYINRQALTDEIIWLLWRGPTAAGK
jgi:hypothetical protein